MKITKAIIPVAGWGTRRLPITKVIEKCMLPIGNRPLIDFLVQDCLKVGITDIYFVVSSENSQLEAFYSHNQPLESYLEANGKASMLPLITPPAANFHFVIQPSDGVYGTAVPVGLCVPFLEPDESVIMMLGDDFVYAPGQPNQVEQLLQATPEGGSGMLGVRVPESDLSRFGVIKMRTDGQFEAIVEKPVATEAPSNLINVSKYVMNAALLRAVADFVEQRRQGEYLITDPINTYVANGGVMKVIPAIGRYLDGGTVDSWLEANRIVNQGK